MENQDKKINHPQNPEKKVSPEDEKIINRVKLRREFDKEVARYLAAADVCQKGYARNEKVADFGLYSDLQLSKKNFYEALDSFFDSGNTPSDRINPESLARFDEYRNAKWTDGEVIKEIREIVKEILA